jgi:hypothetical protein
VTTSVEGNFESKVRAAFAFLETAGAYRVTNSDETHVRYESESIWLECWFDRRAEVSVTFGRTSRSPRDKLDLGTVGRFLGVQVPDGIYSSATTDVAEVLAQMANFMQENCQAWLFGDEYSFADLEDSAAVGNAISTQQSTRDARPPEMWLPVRQAWEGRDFAQLVEAIERLPRPLSKSEEKALDYARKRQR